MLTAAFLQAVNSEPETVCIPLVKPDASGATWFPIKPGTSEPQLLDSKEKMFAAQEFFVSRRCCLLCSAAPLTPTAFAQLDYVQQKRAELAARPSERRERVSHALSCRVRTREPRTHSRL